MDKRPAASHVDFGDLYTAQQFKQLRDTNYITPYDGVGYWSTATHESGVDCFDPRPDWATHVKWYNK